MSPSPTTMAFRQAFCQAIYRAVTERAQDLTGCGLRADMHDLEARILDYASVCDDTEIRSKLSGELRKHGFLPGGWSQRWPARVLCAPEPGIKRSASALTVLLDGPGQKAHAAAQQLPKRVED